MRYWTALIWMACCAGAGAVANKKWGGEQPTPGWSRIWFCAVMLLGGVSGYFASFRFDVPVQLRFLLVLLVLVMAACVDLREKRIPNLCPLVLLLGEALFVLLDFVQHGQQALGNVLWDVLGGLGMLAFLGMCRLLTRGGVGMGDIKLVAAMGLLLRLSGSVYTLLYAQISALICAAVLLLVGKLTRKDAIPFAPFLTLGFSLCIVLGTF